MWCGILSIDRDKLPFDEIYQIIMGIHDLSLANYVRLHHNVLRRTTAFDLICRNYRPVTIFEKPSAQIK